MMKKNRKNVVLFFGFKITRENLVGLIICLFIAVCLSIWTFYKNHILENGETIIVIANIEEVHKRSENRRIIMPQMKCVYYLNNKKHVVWISLSQEMWDSICVGDCIELIVSLEDEHIYQWNKEKGIFKCD